MTTSLKQLATKEILILGFGREGWSTYRFLRQHFPDKKLTIADERELGDLDEEQQQALKQDKNLTMQLGPGYLENINGFQTIFKTPGIPHTLPEIEQAVENGSQLTSNTQLFMELCSGITIGVTGTKGKSTTAAMIHHVLKQQNFDAILAGNIGTPVLSILEEINDDTIVVLELSSHQLATMTVSPQIAVIQEITSEHLDYFPDTAAYQAAKTAITRYQTEQDLVIYNPAFEVVAETAALSKGKHLRHSLEEGPESLAFVRADVITYRNKNQQAFPVLPVKQLPLPGQHNLYNVLPAVIIGGLFNVSPEEIGEALQSFQGLPHRLQLVAEKNGQRFYDDSLATNPHATYQALKSFGESLVLIAGGYERDQDFGDLAQLILEKDVVGLVLFKPTGERLADTVTKLAEQQGKTAPTIKFADSMAEAVQLAAELMSPQGVMLMSPASASFGMFKDYRDRGEQFQKAVKSL